MPSAHTFTIKPIRELLDRYVLIHVGWADLFSGFNSPAYYTNDLNQEAPTLYHMDAKDFSAMLPELLDGIILDPPYSNRQVSEHYRAAGMKATSLDTGAAFMSGIRDSIATKIKKGGHVISCGWNSNGMGKGRGFEIIEILLVAHGGSKNDTIVTVEKKL